MKYLKLSDWSCSPQNNVYHFFNNCARHIAHYLKSNNLNKEDITLCIEDKKIVRSILPYFISAIKYFVNDIKIINEDDNFDIEIIDAKKYISYHALKNHIESLPIYKENKKDVKDIVFIRRRYDPNRCMRALINDEELIEELKKNYGENVFGIYLEDCSFEEQVKLIRGCKLLIGAHGAGLANMWWMNEETSVLELFSQAYFLEGYSALAYIKKINYHHMNGKNIPPTELTFEQFTEETGLCLCCLTFTKNRAAKIIPEDEWFNQQKDFLNNQRRNCFEIDKNELIIKVKSIYHI